MLPPLQHIAEEAATTKALALNFRLLERVPVRLGVMSTIGHRRLARFLSRFEKEHRGLELSVSESVAGEVVYPRPGPPGYEEEKVSGAGE